MIVTPLMSYDDSYRESYRDISVHKMMLSDVVRTEAYERALRQMIRPGFQVMDFGCGTGILSIFAERFGAEAVYAVDRSAFISIARSIAQANGMRRIRFYRDDHDSLRLPTNEVDLIVSEWMGHFIFYEAMLEPLLKLRDRFLGDGGIMIPDRISLFAGLVTDESFFEHLSFFRQNPYGIDFSLIAEAPFYQSNLEFFTPNEISKTVIPLGEMDLYTLRSTPDMLEGRAIPKKAETVYGLCGWFSARLTDDIHIGTGPNDPPTHWNQMFFPLEDPLEISPDREISVCIYPPRDKDNSWTWRLSDGERTIRMNDYYPFDSEVPFGPLDDSPDIPSPPSRSPAAAE